MEPRERIAAASALMARFAARTGVPSALAAPRRYLWTDAHAVCNWIGLHRATGDAGPLRLAVSLVDQVHDVLGRHRGDDGRSGWLSGLPEADGRAHPTLGGLRIGKPLPERAAGERFDERAEWDRDGQYFHYLTRWMHALARVAHATGNRRYLQWAAELGQTAHARFTYTRADDGRRCMYWKMSIDLRRSLVPSMGHHDPLDGLITCLELQADVRSLPRASGLPALDAEIADLRSILGETDCATDDALGIGSLLALAGVLAQLLARGDPRDGGLLVALLRGAVVGLHGFAAGPTLRTPPSRRLAFRELGLAIGLQAIPRIAAAGAAASLSADDRANLRQLLASLSRHVPLAERIVAGWLDPANQATAAWHDHLDIDEVMLATALLPDEHLAAGPTERRV